MERNPSFCSFCTFLVEIKVRIQTSESSNVSRPQGWCGDITTNEITISHLIFAQHAGISLDKVDLPPGISLSSKISNVISPPFPGGGVVDGRFEPHITVLMQTCGSLYFRDRSFNDREFYACGQVNLPPSNAGSPQHRGLPSSLVFCIMNYGAIDNFHFFAIFIKLLNYGSMIIF